MADTDFKFSFATNGSKDGTSGVKEEGRTGSNTGNGSTEGTSSFSFARPGNGEDKSSGSASGAYADAPIGKKRRGRQPYPRDAEGRIIRPDGSIGPKASTANKGDAPRLDTVRNNREKLRTSIEGMHRLAATLTRTEDFLLSDVEANVMTEATADLFDELGWDVTTNGKRNVYLLAFICAATIYNIDGPKLQHFVASTRARNVTPLAPSTATEASNRGSARAGMMDFSEDIANTVNTGESVNAGNGSIRYN